jgi:putative ABC transport system permease protein
MSTLLDDLRFAWRMLLKTRGATFAVLVAFALGLGGNMAMYSIADVLLFHPLRLPAIERLVALPSVVNGRVTDITDISLADFRDLREQSGTLDKPAAVEWWTTNLTGAGDPIQLRGFRVSPTFFDTLQAVPLYGRAFRPDEETPGHDAVAVLSHALWTAHFGADPAVIGRTVRLNDRPYEIVGVMSEDVRFPSPAELWVPLAPTPEQWQMRSTFNWIVIGRLAPNVTLNQASAEIEALTRRIAADHPTTHAGRYAYVAPVRDWISGNLTYRFNMLLLGVVGFVLIIVCANVANVQFARVSSRHRELAVRTALGASRWRLVRQLLIEGILLALLGAASSVLLAVWVTDLMRSSMPAEVKIFLPSWDHLHVNSRAIAYTTLLATLSGIAAGLAAAFGGVRREAVIDLKDGGRGTSGAGRHRLKGALVLCQVVLALVLLVGAGLMIQGFTGLADPIPGSAPEQVLQMQMQLPELRYPDAAHQRAFAERALTQLATVLGASSIALASTLPYSGEGGGSDFTIEGRPPLTASERPHSRTLAISDRYLTTLRIPLVQGRDLTAADDTHGQRVVVVSEAVVRRYFADLPTAGDAVGHRIRFGQNPNAPWVTIVGVAQDVVYDWADRQSHVMVYLPLTQVPRSSLRVAIRAAAGDPLQLAAPARAAITAVDPDLPVSDMSTFRTLIDHYLVGLAYVAWMMGAFGFVALALSVIGIYSVMAYDVNERTREIGVRMALGADPADVLRLVLVRGLVLSGSGLVLGLIASSWVARTLAGIFPNLGGGSSLTALGVIALLLGLTALLACFIPAHRATKVDPMLCLRNE